MADTSRNKIWAVIGASFVAVGLLIRLVIAMGDSHSSPVPIASRPSPDDSAMTLNPGDHPPPRSLCAHVDFQEFTGVFQLQGARDGYNTGLEPEVVSGSMCEQSMSRGGTGAGVVGVTVLCSAWRNEAKAIDGFELGRAAPYGPPEAVSGLGDEAYRYRGSNHPTVGMKVRARNLDCKVEAEPKPPLTDAEADGTFTAMQQLLQTLIPKLAH
ncbi:hypothetical protein OG592_42755 (plasmid) [Streptomyces avidinii]|uniref:hypothetical protein n=1 Tax=Streptomyces avidinii TaxID=1895 RepID=UPI002F909593|nr:hypothetical protein OG592_42755 [Streptomyces avidinii]